MNEGAIAQTHRVVDGIRVLTPHAAYNILKATYQPPKNKYIPQGTEVARITAQLKVGHNPLIEGPSGNGKTTLVENIVSAQNAILVTQMCSEGVDEAKLIGSIYVINSVPEYRDGTFLLAARASQIAPVFIYLDEINNLRPEVRSALHAATDDRKSVTYEVLGEGNVANPKNFHVIMSYNPNRLKALENSWMTRTDVIRLGYPESTVEQQILLEVGGLKGFPNGSNIAEGMVKFANAIRGAKGYEVKNGDAGVLADAGLKQEQQAEITLVREAPSTRLLVKTCELIVLAGEKSENAMQNIYDSLLAGVSKTGELEKALVDLAGVLMPKF